MADDDTPVYFNRERNLSNRNFNKRGSRRRFSIDSVNSFDSTTTSSATTETAETTTTRTTSTTTSGSAELNCTTSSSFQYSYSVNSDTESAFNRKSKLKMIPASTSESDNAEDNENQPARKCLDTPDPALLDVKQKVLRFETLQAEEKIPFKTGKFKWKPTILNTPVRTFERGSFGPLRVLPEFTRRKKLLGTRADDNSPIPHQISIDEEHTEDEVDEFSDYVDDESDVNGDANNGDGSECETTKESKKIEQSTVHPSIVVDEVDKEDSIEEHTDEFGYVNNGHKSSSPISPVDIILHTVDDNEIRSPSITEVIKKRGTKDFPRNYRSTPRPKTEIVGVKNRAVVAKHNSVYHRKNGTSESTDDEEIELRAKSDACVHPILEELIKTEETYVQNLFIGLKNYGNIFERDDIPTGLRGKKYVLLGNIEQIAEFHRDEFLPMLHRNRRNLMRLFDEFIQFIEANCFYGYVIFTMNKKRSLDLCDIYKNYFKSLQSELDDKLGINSFLVQPIQRMARYPLLLNEFISTLFKHDAIIMKPLIESCCRLEKRVRTLLKITNESEVINDIIDCNEFNVFYQGKFRKVSEFMVFDHTLKRSYRSKVFIFDKCIIYTEIKSKNLIFHGRYPCEHIGILANKSKSFTLYYEQRKKQECDFSGDPQLVEMWLELIRDMINSFVTEERKNLQERYTRESDHLHYKPPPLSLFRDSNRFSSDSGIGNIWALPKADLDEQTNNRTTWYAIT